MEIQVTEFKKPVITINYEDLKKHLEERLAEYDGLVVTEETLKSCKAAQKELAGLRKDIDSYRKEKKKEVEEPVCAFEAQCKDLISLVEKVENPIREGISFFDSQRREEKRKRAQEIIEEECMNAGLNEKYTGKCLLLDKYTNLTATETRVREEVSRQCFALKIEQDREEERDRLIEETIGFENQRLKNKISLNNPSFRRIIDLECDTSEVIARIRTYAASLYEAENSKEPGEPPKPPEEEQKKREGDIRKAPEQEYCAVYKITASADVLRSVSQFLRNSGITYEVLSQEMAGTE